MPKGACPKPEKGGDKPGDDGDKKNDDGKPDGTGDKNKPEGDDKTDFKPTNDWLEQLTGEKPPANGNGSSTGSSGSGSAGSGAGANGTGTSTSQNGGAGTEATGSSGGNGGTLLSFKVAYSIVGQAIIVLLLWLVLRTIPMWKAMRASLAIEWVKDKKAAGGLVLMLRRRGGLATATAKVRYHMTQLWG